MAFPDYTFDIFESFEDSTLETGLTENDSGGALTIPSSTQYYIGSNAAALNLASMSARAHICYGSCGDRASFGWWYRSGSYSNWAGGPQIFNLRSNAAGNLIRVYDARDAGDNTREFECEGNKIGISDYTWYWITILFNRNATGYIRVYNTSGELVGSGSFTCPDNAADEGAFLGAWQTDHACTVYFDGYVIDKTNGNFPLLGWETTAANHLLSIMQAMNQFNGGK